MPEVQYRARNRAHTRASTQRQPTSTHNTARAEEKRDEKEEKERWMVKGRGGKRQGEGEEKVRGKDGRRGQEGEARRSKGRGREGKGDGSILFGTLFKLSWGPQLIPFRNP